MKRRHAVAVIVAMLALFVGLAGCAQLTTSGDPNENFPGTWAVDDMTVNGERQGAQELELAKTMGIYLTLENGGKATYEIFGHSVDGSWTASDGTHAKLTIEEEKAGEVSLGSESDLVFADGKISMDNGQDSLKFKKIDPSEKKSVEIATQTSDLELVSEEQAGTQMGNSVNVSGYAILQDARPLDLTVADDAVCSIKVTSLGDYYGNPGYLVQVTNKTDNAIMADNDGDFTVNGRVGGVNFSTSVPAKGTSEETLWFENIDTAEDGVDAVTNVSGRIVVTNSDTGEKMATYDFSA